MIIKCKKIISPATKKLLDSSPWRTRDKNYPVLALVFTLNRGIFAIIISDHQNIPIFASLEGFEVISQKVPKSWGYEILHDFYNYMMPKSWMYPEFFENLENEEPKAMALFKEEANLIYQLEGLTSPI